MILPMSPSTFAIMVVLLLAAGCASSTIDSRKQERAAEYARLPAPTKALIDTGRIQVGMTPAAVYIAWGPPAQVTQSENPSGAATIWIYEGGWLEENRYWSHHQLLRDYQPRTYVRAEVVFVNGIVREWRTLPQPAD